MKPVSPPSQSRVVRSRPLYRAPFITIWHVDPEKDGSDDSCEELARLERARQYAQEVLRDVETAPKQER